MRIQNISQTKNHCENGSIVFFNGRAIVVWNENDPPYNIHCRVRHNIWYEPERMLNTKRVNSVFPQVAIDSKSLIHMVWMEGNSSGDRDIAYICCKDGFWPDKLKYAYRSPGNSCWPRIAIDEDDRIHVVWSEKLPNRKYEILYRWKKANVNTWSSVINISQSKDEASLHPALYVRNKKLYCCWQQGTESNWKIWFSENTNGTWSEPINISGGRSGWFSSICVDSVEDVHVLFSTVYSVHRTEGEWGNPQKVSGSRHSKGFVSIDVDKNNVLHGVWLQNTDEGKRDVFYASYDFNWSEPIQISNGGWCGVPVVKISEDGYAHIVWFVEHGNVFYKKKKIKDYEIPEIPDEPEDEIPEIPEIPGEEPEPPTKPKPTLQCNTCHYYIIIGGKKYCGNLDWKSHNEQSCPYYKEEKMEPIKQSAWSHIFSTKNPMKDWLRFGRFWKASTWEQKVVGIEGTILIGFLLFKLIKWIF